MIKILQNVNSGMVNVVMNYPKLLIEQNINLIYFYSESAD